MKWWYTVTFLHDDLILKFFFPPCTSEDSSKNTVFLASRPSFQEVINLEVSCWRHL
jgi:hypothetical protein